ncbi:hypothetical protein [Paracoccus sp. (in: a-proteobacteria)]|uniref:hypothetical protein n=1 Tax=Paracoccus sp. TaxID=267 RepID=UPI0026DEECF7|nr:hypothetical protein [Paracoccus sp. (in: a-proteobacteria)]MDO5646690.1 hypothetical protein [Paracoccus sp. (in: a-proteobacteria)]
MKFSTRIDTDLSANQLFDATARFERIERYLTANGVDVRRIDPAQEVGVVRGWNLTFDFRGAPRDVRLVLTRHDRPQLMTLMGQGDLLDVQIDISFIALSRSRARMMFEMDLRPRGMKARLILQTAKLRKKRLDNKFVRRVTDFSRFMQENL